MPRRSGVLDGAKRFHCTHNVSFWNAMILAACLDASVRTLYSAVIPGLSVVGIPVVNLFT